MPAWTKKLAAALISTLVALALLEVGFRALQRSRFESKLASYSHELWLPRPNMPYLYELTPSVTRENRIPEHPDGGWTYTIGANGRRVTASPVANAARIVTLGDSYTFGWGVDDADSYPAQLERILRERDGAAAINVINAGIPGFNSWQQAALLHENWDALAPDIVILGFVMNDAEPTRVVPRDPDMRYGMATMWLWEDLILRLGMADGPFTSRLQRQRPYLEQFQDGTPEQVLCKRALGRIAAKCKEHGVPLLLFVFPDTTGFKDEGYPYGAIHQTVAGWGTDLGVPSFDLLPLFEGASREEFSVPGDGHPNAKALGRFARRIADEVVPLLD